MNLSEQLELLLLSAAFGLLLHKYYHLGSIVLSSYRHGTQHQFLINIASLTRQQKETLNRALGTLDELQTHTELIEDCMCRRALGDLALQANETKSTVEAMIGWQDELVDTSSAVGDAIAHLAWGLPLFEVEVSTKDAIALVGKVVKRLANLQPLVEEQKLRADAMMDLTRTALEMAQRQCGSLHPVLEGIDDILASAAVTERELIYNNRYGMSRLLREMFAPVLPINDLLLVVDLAVAG